MSFRISSRSKFGISDTPSSWGTPSKSPFKSHGKDMFFHSHNDGIKPVDPTDSSRTLYDSAEPLIGLQFLVSSFSRSIISVIFGRLGDSEVSNSSAHVWSNNAHNESENPSVGRSGRSPPRTFRMIAAAGLVCSKGRRPETTYGGKVRLHGG